MNRIRKLLSGITSRTNGSRDIISWTSAPDGLNFSLFPRQQLVLKLISGLTQLDTEPRRPPAESNQAEPYTESTDLVRLLTADNPHAAIWLPPDWQFDSAADTIHIPNPPLIVLLIAGRRSGKTSIASIALAHRLIQLSRRKRFPGVKLLKGQTVGAINVAADERQARLLFERTVENLHIAGLVPAKYPASGSLRIGRRVLYECLATSAGAVRGRTAALCALDELAHFPGVHGPASAERVFDALLPSVRTFGNLGRIIITTSPAGRQGKVWELYEARGKMDGLLVMQFATWEMHPFITREMLQPEFDLDPDMAACEYGAQFINVDSPFLNSDSVASCVRPSSATPLPIDKHIPRRIHLDLAFARDRFAIAVGHSGRGTDDGNIVIDEVLYFEPAPGAPLDPSNVESAVREISTRYNIREVSFDQYCAPYLQRQLEAMGLCTRRIDFTSSSKMAIYSNLRTIIAAHKISLPQNPDLISELTHLRRTLRPGGFSVSAPSSGSVTTDDIADAVATLAYLLLKDSEYDGQIIYKPGAFY